MHRTFKYEPAAQIELRGTISQSASLPFHTGPRRQPPEAAFGILGPWLTSDARAGNKWSVDVSILASHTTLA